MNPPTCTDDAFGNFAAVGAGTYREFGRKVMSGIITKVMNPPTWGFVNAAERGTTNSQYRCSELDCSSSSAAGNSG
jgi:hypothetical protein